MWGVGFVVGFMIILRMPNRSPSGLMNWWSIVDWKSIYRKAQGPVI